MRARIRTQVRGQPKFSKSLTFPFSHFSHQVSPKFRYFQYGLVTDSGNKVRGRGSYKGVSRRKHAPVFGSSLHLRKCVHGEGAFVVTTGAL